MWYVYAIPTDGRKGWVVGMPYLSWKLAHGVATFQELICKDGCRYVVRARKQLVAA